MKITDAKVFVCSPGRNFVTLKIYTDQGVYGLGDATLNGRETAQVNNPKPGTWLIIVSGYEVFGQLAPDGTESGPKVDNYTVSVY